MYLFGISGKMGAVPIFSGLRPLKLSVLKRSVAVLNQKHELQGMDRRRFETKMLIKTAGPVVLRMDKDGPYAGNFRRSKRPQNRIFQQTPADLFPLMINVNGL
ncbi:MAG: hypothetical protein M0P04_11815 [Syntrophales bacterium]|nr:hypothetical protein [Syntrophales bacterium]